MVKVLPKSDERGHVPGTCDGQSWVSAACELTAMTINQYASSFRSVDLDCKGGIRGENNRVENTEWTDRCQNKGVDARIKDRSSC